MLPKPSVSVVQQTPHCSFPKPQPKRGDLIQLWQKKLQEKSVYGPQSAVWKYSLGILNDVYHCDNTQHLVVHWFDSGKKGNWTRGAFLSMWNIGIVRVNESIDIRPPIDHD